MRTKTSKSKVGKQFEDEIAQLLILAGFDVRREILLTYKKVDLYIEEKRLGSLRRIAVECKNFARPLSQSEVTTIYSNYWPLCEANLIDEILIVTSSGLAPSALSMVKVSKKLAHMTSAEIFDLVMDFNSYLYGLQRQFDENGLSWYYTPPVTPNGKDFEELILEWISTPDAPPLAVLGSYGTGKTTLAKRMASLLSLRAREDRHQRIPILVKLGEISTEQSLEGLLGKLFTAHSVVHNYSFDLFMALNLQGRFVIFLDGFDEMKYSLSWHEMRYNFRQLNRLVGGKSKTILLGRPTAFLNDEEYRYALRGLRQVGGREVRELGWPEFTEINLTDFSEEQAKAFLRKYLNYLSESSTKQDEKDRLRRTLEEQVDNLFGKDFSDLVRRPVQLKMLAEVLPNWQGQARDLTVSKLYSHFIDIIIEREQEKVVRRHFDVPTRRSFARELAVFLWRNRGELSITADRIPQELIDHYASPEDDPDSVRRDLVAACFLDRKLGDSLFFPHRSFQEFLVAEAIMQELNREGISLLEAGQLTNKEVVDFIKDMLDMKTVKQWCLSLEDQGGLLSRNFAEILIFKPEIIDFLWERCREIESPWHIALLTLAARTGRLSQKRSRQLLSMAMERIWGSIGRYALVCFWSILLLGNEDEVREALVHLTKIQVFGELNNRLFMPDHSIVHLFSSILPDKEETIDIRECFDALIDALVDFCLIGDKAAGKVDLFECKLDKKIIIPISAVPEIIEYQKNYCNPMWSNANWQRKGPGDTGNELKLKRRDKRAELARNSRLPKRGRTHKPG